MVDRLAIGSQAIVLPVWFRLCRLRTITPRRPEGGRTGWFRGCVDAKMPNLSSAAPAGTHLIQTASAAHGRPRTALICGISGQDGSLLARLLLGKGYRVWGTSRDAQGSSLLNLQHLDIRENVTMASMVQEDFRSVLTVLYRCRPDEVYFLSGQSSVGLSFEQPAETMQSFALGTLNILEACRMVDFPVRLYNAASSECFGDTGGVPASEHTPFHPRSPYAVAKASAYWLVNNYREAYGLFACSGLLFNHESHLRPPRFVTRKIIAAAVRIAAGHRERLHLGRLDIARDWGWAPEYVEAMWRMLQLDEPDDFVIATGVTSTLEAFVAHAFATLGLDWRDHVVQDERLMRPTDLLCSSADASKARERLGWSATTTMHGVVEKMIDLEAQGARGG